MCITQYSALLFPVSSKSSIIIWSNNKSPLVLLATICTLARILQLNIRDITAPPKTGSWFKLLTEPDTNTTDEQRSIVPPHQCHWVNCQHPFPVACGWRSGVRLSKDASDTSLPSWMPLRRASVFASLEKHKTRILNRPATQANTTPSTTTSTHTHKKDTLIPGECSFLGGLSQNNYFNKTVWRLRALAESCSHP